jgi:hypothetical protein
MPYKVRGRTFDEFVINEEIVSGARTVSEADVVNFAMAPRLLTWSIANLPKMLKNRLIPFVLC